MVNALVERSAQVKKDIDAGVIHLPHPGEGCVWALHDSGSSINAADHDRHFPGAELDATPVAGTYHNANGQPFTNKGQFDIPFRSENRHKRQLNFLDAPVSMPIYSSNLWAKQGFQSVLDETWGETTQKASGEKDPLVVRNGV